MPTYKLTYFNTQGRAELARLIMAYGEIEYEDVRLTQEQWLELKPNTPYGGLPLLEVDGEMLCQSQAIYHFLAKKAGLMGKTDMDAARVDMINGCLEDYINILLQLFYESDEERKKALCKKFKEGLPAETAKLENLLKGDYFVGNQMTMADINTYHILNVPKQMGFNINMDDYPKLKALVGKVEGDKNIAAWIKKRPK